MTENRLAPRERQRLALAEAILNRLVSDDSFRRRLVDDPISTLEEAFGPELAAVRADSPPPAEVSGYLYCQTSCGNVTCRFTGE